MYFHHNTEAASKELMIIAERILETIGNSLFYSIVSQIKNYPMKKSKNITTDICHEVVVERLVKYFSLRGNSRKWHPRHCRSVDSVYTAPYLLPLTAIFKAVFLSASYRPQL